MAWFGLFGRKRKNRELIERLYAVIVQHARLAGFYRDLGVPDTVDGRFELLTLYMTLVTRRLRVMASPGPDIAQDLVDLTFGQFEAALREMGVGDISVPKRMKVMAGAFLGRASAYDQALRSGDRPGLETALTRNLYGKSPTPLNAVEKIADNVLQSVEALENLSMDAYIAGQLPFPVLVSDPAP
jgi:cytochrome b pre-mRNA-processing protein 3